MGVEAHTWYLVSMLVDTTLLIEACLERVLISSLRERDREKESEIF